MELKDKLKARRKELGLTMLEVANKVGVSEGTISRWESGDIKSLKIQKALKFSEVLGCSIDELFGKRREVVHSACREMQVYQIMGVICDKYCKYPDLCRHGAELDKLCDVCEVAKLLGCE